MVNDFTSPHWILSIMAMTLMIPAYYLAIRFADRMLAPNDPKRDLVQKSILYGSTGLLLLILWLLR